MPVKARPTKERFWNHVEKTDGCYYAYESIYGVRLKKGIHVSCKYGNRFCIRPDHLYIGSPSEDIKKNLPETIENFWNKVNKTKECWTWTGNISKSNGYGRFNYIKNSKGYMKYGYAHRFSYELHYGTIPKGMFVCHHCDNRICVNPFHFFLGRQKENSGLG